jgi:hypothetical protein
LETDVDLGLVLLPEQRLVVDRLARYAGAVCTSGKPLMMIGEDAPPHLTLIHITTSLAAAKVIFDRAAARLGFRLPVRLSGLMFAPIPTGDYHVPEGGIYVGLEALRTPALDFAHRFVCNEATRFGAKILTPAGDDFRPHITLGILTTYPVRPIPLPPEVVKASFNTSLRLGRLGRNGTVPDILSSHEN